MARLSILFAVSECFPFAKTGGLGDVAGALPIALKARGHDVRVVMPRYASTKRHASVELAGPLAVPMGWGLEFCAVHRSEIGPEGGRVPVYLLDHQGFFDRDGVYGDKQGTFGDNLERYGFLSRGALELCRWLGWAPDVFHVHDWMTSLVPVHLSTSERGSELARAASVLTIHNLGYQGWHDRADAWKLGLYGDLPERAGLVMKGSLNLLKAGIHQATIVSTVSPTYAREIQTDGGGEGLDHVLRGRGGDVLGVLNGIDDVVWNPSADKHIAAPFSAADLTGKAACKADLQRVLGLAERPDVPVVGLVSRLVGQKGIDVFADALPRLLAEDAQFVVLGSGDAESEGLFTHLSHTTSNFRAFIGMNEPLAHKIEAGSDFFLMPSRYEPCGLNQLYSQRYGTLPIVRNVGGLADTVDNASTGFKFDVLDAEALANTVLWALSVFRDEPALFRAMQRRSMEKPLGWGHTARQYEALYRLAIGRRRGRF
ncbi:MAG: glycogen/starch synthase [Polyangiaceae bacterium]